MSNGKILITLIIAACCLLIVQPVQAQSSDDRMVIYQTSFASDPRWTTNNPSTNYWDPNMGMYHFSIEPSTGSFAFIPVDYERGSFTLEYDVIIERIDEGATFRMGLSGVEMDQSKGPNVLTQFTNAKYGQIMWLHIVTPGSKLLEVNSQHEPVELGLGSYNGPTVKYEANKTYHVTVDYDDMHKIISMKVTDKITGKEIWGYYLNSWENLRGMNRIFLGSKGDYGRMNIYALGYIDNIRLTAPAPASATPTLETTPPMTPVPETPTKKLTSLQTNTVPTPYPTSTQQSSFSGILVIAALGFVCLVTLHHSMRKN